MHIMPWYAHTHTDTATHSQELTKAHSCGICASEKTKGFNAMSLTQLALQPMGYKSWPGLIQSLAGDDQGQTFNTSLLVP